MAAVSLERMRGILSDDSTKPVSIVADASGFHIRINKQVLVISEGGKTPKIYKNLTSAVHFLKAEGISSITVDLEQLPPRKRKTAKPKAAKANASKATTSTAKPKAASAKGKAA